MRRAIEHLTRARNCVAKGEAVLRWQQRTVTKLIEDGHHGRALQGQRMLVNLQGILSVMRDRLRTMEAELARSSTKEPNSRCDSRW
jgi:hypothetical protein